VAEHEHRMTVAGTEMTLVGTIAGYVPDAERVAAALRGGPDLIALGIPPEDLEGLRVLREEKPELPELDPQTERLFELLKPWGECRVPSPDLEEAYQAAMAANTPLAALDLDDEAHSELYIRTVGFRQAVRSGKLLRKALKADFSKHKDPYELAVAWEAFQTNLKPLRAVEAAREDHMARRLIEVSLGKRRVVAILPIARLAGVTARLEARSGKASP
jgi:hypothetical protein